MLKSFGSPNSSSCLLLLLMQNLDCSANIKEWGSFPRCGRRRCVLQGFNYLPREPVGGRDFCFSACQISNFKNDK